MSSLKRKEKERRAKRDMKNRIITYAILDVIGWYYTMQTASFMHDNIGNKKMPKGILDNLLIAYERIPEAPFKLYLKDTKAWMLWLMVTLFFAAFIVIFELRIKLHHHDINIEGDSEWLDGDSLQEWNDTNVEPIEVKGKDMTQETADKAYSNLIYADQLFKTINTRHSFKNNNLMVVGGAGTGKSRFLVKPNLLQANASFVVTDPSGGLLHSEGEFLRSKGYTIKVFNLTEMYNSDHYNPMLYIRKETFEKDIRTLVECVVNNTQHKDSHSGDPFWENSMKALLSSFIYYLYLYYEPSERTFSNVMRMIRGSKIEDEDNPSAMSPTDMLFEEIRKTDPNSIAVKKYDAFKIGAGKTLKSILITCSTRFDVFDEDMVEKLTGNDTLNLETIGDTKTALFIIIPDMGSAYNFLAATLYSQLFDTLYFYGSRKAQNGTLVMASDREPLKLFDAPAVNAERERAFSDANKYAERLQKCVVKHNEKAHSFDIVVPPDEDCNVHVKVACRGYAIRGANESEQSFSERKNKAYKDALEFCEKCKKPIVEKRKDEELPLPVRLVLDEFANIGEIPSFEKALSTMRKYNLSCTIIIQDLSQLKGMYKDGWSTIMNNCDAFLYLGGQAKETLEYFEAILGTETETAMSTSVSVETSKSNSNSFSEKAAKLMSLAQMREMDDAHCIVIIRGVHPFYGEKYKLQRHRNYKYSADANSVYEYTIGNYFVQPNEKKTAKAKSEEVRRSTENQRKEAEKSVAKDKPQRKPFTANKENMSQAMHCSAEEAGERMEDAMLNIRFDESINEFNFTTN